jgi:NitT/TauT family transport system ATP-binding protein
LAIVALEAVGKTYRGRTGAWEAVRDFNLSLQEGEFFCLLGTSGCGKTTVLNMLAGFEAPTAGRICWTASRCVALAPIAAWCSRGMTASMTG